MYYFLYKVNQEGFRSTLSFYTLSCYTFLQSEESVWLGFPDSSSREVQAPAFTSLRIRIQGMVSEYVLYSLTMPAEGLENDSLDRFHCACAQPSSAFSAGNGCGNSPSITITIKKTGAFWRRLLFFISG